MQYSYLYNIICEGKCVCTHLYFNARVRFGVVHLCLLRVCVCGICVGRMRERERQRGEEHEKRESDLTIAAVMCKPGVSSIIFAFAIIAALIAFRAIELTEHGAGTSSHDCWSFFTALTQHVYPEVVEAVAHPAPPHKPH